MFLRFYSDNPSVRLPPNNNTDCNDDIALAEFEGNIRFGFIYRPNFYDKTTLDYIFSERLGLQKEIPLDAMVYNDVGIVSRPLNSIFPKRRLTIEFLNDALIRRQQQDLGDYYAASNPGIIGKDVHPCMPGIPDDEAYLILFLLLTGYWA